MDYFLNEIIGRFDSLFAGRFASGLLALIFFLLIYGIIFSSYYNKFKNADGGFSWRSLGASERKEFILTIVISLIVSWILYRFIFLTTISGYGFPAWFENLSELIL